MKHKKVKSMDLEFSAVGLGCWQFSGKDAWSSYDYNTSIKTVETAIDNGINFFDVAPIYGMGQAEEVLGDAIKQIGNRDKIIIASKFGLVWNDEKQVSNNHSKASIITEVDQSLKRLKTDYIDVYQAHWPDGNVPVEDMMETLLDLKKSGKIRYIGLSNHSVEQAKRALKVGEVNSMQGLYNLIERNPKSYHGIGLDYRSEDEVFPLCEEHGMAFLPYSPLMQGLLTGKLDMTKINSNDVRNSNPELRDESLKQNQAKVAKLTEVAKELGITTAQLSMAYLVAQKNVTSIIAGASSVEQIKENASAGDITLDKQTIDKINTLMK